MSEFKKEQFELSNEDLEQVVGGNGENDDLGVEGVVISQASKPLSHRIPKQVTVEGVVISQGSKRQLNDELKRDLDI